MFFFYFFFLWPILKPCTDYYRPTLGIYNRCLRIHGRLNCASFIGRQESSVTERHGDHFPIAWQASLVLFSAGLCLLVLTLLAAIFGWCFRSVGRKSIFSISGSIQALSGDLPYILLQYIFSFSRLLIIFKIWRCKVN